MKKKRQQLAQQYDIPFDDFLAILDLIEAPESDLITLPTIARSLEEVLPLLHVIAPDNFKEDTLKTWLVYCKKIVKYDDENKNDIKIKAEKKSNPLWNLITEYQLYAALFSSPPEVTSQYSKKEKDINATFRHLQAHFINATVELKKRDEKHLKKNGFRSTRKRFSEDLRGKIKDVHCLYIHENLTPVPIKAEEFHKIVSEKKTDKKLPVKFRNILNSLYSLLDRALGYSVEGTRVSSSNVDDWVKEEFPPKQDVDDDSPHRDPLRIMKLGAGKGDNKRKYDTIQINRPLKVKKGESPAFQHLKAKLQARYIATANQLLPSRWDNLNYYEIYQLLTEVILPLSKGVFEDPNLTKREQHELAALFTIMIFVSKPHEQAWNTIVKRQRTRPSSNVKNNSIYLFLQNRKWALPVLRPDRARKVTELNAPFVRKSHKAVILPILPEIWKLIDPWLMERRTHVETKKKSFPLFEIDPQRKKLLEKRLKGILTNINQRLNTRITLHRMSSCFKQMLADHCGDFAKASLLLNDLPISGQINPLYYYNINLNEVEDQYSKVCELFTSALQSKEHLPPLDKAMTRVSNKPHQIGSSVCPTSDCISTIVSNLYDRVHYERNNSHDVSSFVAFHNAFTSYCMMMLAFSSGYRAVSNPLVSLSEIDLDQGFLVISDKDNNDNFNSRLVWVPQLCCDQLRVYNNYRQNSEEKFYMLNSEIASQLRDEYHSEFSWPKEKRSDGDQNKLPFFFYLQHTSSPSLVKAISVRSGHDFSWEYSIPDNANRHYLRTKLSEAGIEGEIIDAFMGHWLRGQEPFGRFSTLSPEMVANILDKPLTKILKDNGWKVINVN